MREHWLRWTVLGLALAATVGVVAYAAQEGKVQLPQAVRKVLDSNYPGAAVEEVELDSEGVRVFEVELKMDGKEVEVGIALDGTVVEEEVEVAL
jgi:hypothetical protein